jgi:FlaA1/EpsC-like NDP-sugar epimerase
MSDTETRPRIADVNPAAVIQRVRAMPRQGATKPHSLSPEALAVAAKPQASPISPIVLAGFVRMGEFALIVVVGMAIYAAYLKQFDGLVPRYLLATLSIAVLSIFAFQTADIYQVQAFRGHEKQYFRLASAWSLVFLIVIGATFFAKAGELFSRIWLAAFYAVGLVSLMVSRRMVFLLVRKWTQEGRLTRRTVIVGGGEPGAHVIEELRRQKDTGVKIIGLFDDRGDDRTGLECAGERKLGTVDDLVEFGRRTRVDLVIFSLPISAESRILQMLKKLWVLPVDIRLAAHSNKLQFRPRSYSYIGKVPVLDVADRPIADWDVVMKWLFDKIVGGLILLCALPAMALIALAVQAEALRLQ